MMEKPVLRHDLYTSPLMPEVMQRWAGISDYDITESMDFSADEIDLELVDSRVIEVLNKRAPEALQKWRKATAALIAIQRFRDSAEKREQSLREHLAKEAAEEFHLETRSSSSYPQSAEEIAHFLGVPLIEKLSDETTSLRPEWSFTRHPTPSQQAFSEWSMLVTLLDLEWTRSTWTRMVADLNLAISNNIGPLLQPMTSTTEKVLLQMTESVGVLSTALHTTINKIHGGLTDAFQKLKDMVDNCIKKLSRDCAPVKVKKHFAKIFEDNDNLVKQLGEGQTLVKTLNDLVKGIDGGELLAARKECASSITTLVSSHLEPHCSNFIPVTAFIDDFLCKEDGSSNERPPSQTLSSSLASDLNMTCAESHS